MSECIIFSGHTNFRQKPTATLSIPTKHSQVPTKILWSGSVQTEGGQGSINWSENYRLVLASLVNPDRINRFLKLRIVKDLVVHFLKVSCLIDESELVLRIGRSRHKNSCSRVATSNRVCRVCPHFFTMGDQLRWALCLSGNPPLCVLLLALLLLCLYCGE